MKEEGQRPRTTSTTTVSSLASTLSPPLEPSPPQPSIRLLFSPLPTRKRCFLLLPAVLASTLAGGTAPLMTIFIGQNFDAFSRFPTTPNPPDTAKRDLLHAIGIVALQLSCLAFITLALSFLTSSLWISIGEHITLNVRKQVYQSVSRKEMIWFDAKMGSEVLPDSAGEQGPLGAGGLMAKFLRETDDVRTATSLASSSLLQHITTTIACLVLAFIRSPALTAVILSSVPILMFVQGFAQKLVGSLSATERQNTAVAATLVDRAVSSITTVKAFNAQGYETSTLSSVLSRGFKTMRSINLVWACTNAISQFVVMSMFVQAFWFGSVLVRAGKISPGDVMAVFWACLIAAGELQMCFPHLITLNKGTNAIAALLTLCQSYESKSLPQSRPRKLRRRSTITEIKKICPPRCEGEISMHSISFAYPTRPDVPVLRDVSLYLPAKETTFIVGGSGSGKSTIAALLLRMYHPTTGRICIDDQDIKYLDNGWIKEHLAGVSQECTVFDGSVHDNVAIALDREVSREEVIQVCRAALIHDFIRDLPDGYDTRLGNEGTNLSGGQRQRLAIARAELRNPSVLILDEGTSALDYTSRVLVFEALKYWRQGRTTVVITHDLSQIEPQDFVYVLKAGEIIEQGYRSDLEAGDGEFRSMAESQGQTGGGLLAKTLDEGQTLEFDRFLDIDEEDDNPVNRPMTPSSHWMFEAIAKLTERAPEGANRDLERQALPAHRLPQTTPKHRRTSSIQITIPKQAHFALSRRLSLQFSPSSPVSPSIPQIEPDVMSVASDHALITDDESFEGEKSNLTRSGTTAAALRRAKSKGVLRKNTNAMVAHAKRRARSPNMKSDRDSESLWQLVKDVYPTVPHKFILLFGLVFCMLCGLVTPVFSFLLSRLLFEVSIGASRVAIINKFGGIVLGVAAADGLFLGFKYFIMETNAMSWVTHIRKKAFGHIMAQDKKWFDQSTHSAPTLVQILIKDGDDARGLLSTVIGQCLVVVTMVSVGLTWALVLGWQLTLVGLGIAPVFAGAMALLTKYIGKCEASNKRARQDVAKGYYEVISNIRGIRSMGLESAFDTHFQVANQRALSTGLRGAFFEGCGRGVANGLIYCAEALLFYVGAVLISKGIYTYLQMVQVLNLVVFTVTIGSQLMAFTERIAKSLQATRDLNELIKLSKHTDESHGSCAPHVRGPITFDNVSFAYPERPNVQVLRKVSLRVDNGECVAIVGSSGSGKSTVAALLQRLYEPNSGAIRVDGRAVRNINVRHLRYHVSVVSQNPKLFDATIRENIAYGCENCTDADVRAAAKAANVDDFIESLPQGYDTMVGENASLISGGQAQRLQIARALARPSTILILDECTSALDAANQAAVMETIRTAKKGRTTIMVTHKLPVMQMCDRILVVDQGEIVESGTYEELLSLNGVFATLARGGEWHMN